MKSNLRGLAAGILAGSAWLAMAGTAQAFNLTTKSDSSVISDGELRSVVLGAASSIGNTIPDNPNIKIYAYTRVINSKIGPTAGGAAGQDCPGQATGPRYVYFHRIEFRRAFAAGPPYGYAGWLPVQSEERYGVADEAGIKAALDEAAKAFFTRLKDVDPQQGFK